ncbi:MAG TPA: glutaredoxin family protein, partial [Burkholderiaceae bacterium]|nr:glutaredoxin family protein [Burkholderiaceae bacterium]
MKANHFPWIAAGSALLALASIAAQAQPMYRIVGPDGKVTFSDRPPAEGAGGKSTATSAATRVGTDSGANLPFEVREVANRYPVTLYSAPNCSPCASARNLLVNRGVPFAERTVSTNEDAEALQRVSGDTSLPFATIGGQQLKGFSDVEWTQYLDAAGYAKTSQLPSNYRQPPATPLVAVKRADEA